jgi:hypothetical protein
VRQQPIGRVHDRERKKRAADQPEGIAAERCQNDETDQQQQAERFRDTADREARIKNLLNSEILIFRQSKLARQLKRMCQCQRHGNDQSKNSQDLVGNKHGEAVRINSPAAPADPEC